MIGKPLPLVLFNDIAGSNTVFAAEPDVEVVILDLASQDTSKEHL